MKVPFSQFNPDRFSFADDPVLVLEHKYLYKRLQGPVPDEDYIVPIGKGDIKREGEDVTIIAMSS